LTVERMMKTVCLTTI